MKTHSEFEPVTPYWAAEQLAQEREDRAFMCGCLAGVLLTVVAAFLFMIL